jgi:hypothetical protein
MPAAAIVDVAASTTDVGVTGCALVMDVVGVVYPTRWTRQWEFLHPPSSCL